MSRTSYRPRIGELTVETGELTVEAPPSTLIRPLEERLARRCDQELSDADRPTANGFVGEPDPTRTRARVDAKFVVQMQEVLLHCRLCDDERVGDLPDRRGPRAEVSGDQR